jgi:hypothetical protein
MNRDSESVKLSTKGCTTRPRRCPIHTFSKLKEMPNQQCHKAAPPLKKGLPPVYSQEPVLPEGSGPLPSTRIIGTRSPQAFPSFAHSLPLLLLKRHLEDKMKLYRSSKYSTRWFAYSPALGWVMFPAEINGWAKREKARGIDPIDVREVPLRLGFNTGITEALTTLCGEGTAELPQAA